MRLTPLTLLACLAALAVAVPASAGSRVVDRVAARAALAQGAKASASARAAARIRRPTWVRGVTVTEYYPVPERWFVGDKVRAPGLSGLHRIDWLYSARGLTMEGDGVGLDGKRYSIEAVGSGGWVDRLGRRSCVGCARGVYWRAGGFYRNSANRLTYPLDAGGWFNGVGLRWVPLPGVRFDTGPSLDLTYYASLAVDPRVIPLGSRVYIPYYAQRRLGNGWFRAQDTGGAIGGRHVDVYRPAPDSGGGRSLRDQRIYVVPPR
ncbi:MAG TPA: 3D domain-containing protein [Solirubrobacteraceae bacterium]|nr:3D domain-containing protein [Solirubrobacteraceae bacterium]